MMNYNEQKTVIDVSDAVNISDLGIRIKILRVLVAVNYSANRIISHSVCVNVEAFFVC